MRLSSCRNAGPNSPTAGAVHATSARIGASGVPQAPRRFDRMSLVSCTERPHFVPHSLSGLRAFLYGQALFLKQVLQLTRLEHLADDIAAADEFSLNVELRDGRPVGIRLDAVAHVVVFEDVEPFIGNPQIVQDLHHLARESAHWELRGAL